MRVAIVASSFLPEQGRMERRVAQLARGLAQRGAEVEVLVQGPARSTLGEFEDLTIRRFPSVFGPLRFSVAPKLWERLRLMSDAFDIVDVHSRRPPLALAVGRARVRRLVFTPGARMDAFVGWPYRRATQSLIGATTQIVCHSELDRDLLCQTLPGAAERTIVVPDGVDVEKLGAARPFATEDIVVLAVDRLDRDTGVGRAIAAMPSLGPEFRLVIVGDGAARFRLSAYAADLRISDRVQFVGAVRDAVLYRWLRTARVVLALAGEHGSGSQVTEARAAGVPVVASDLPIHRRAAEGPGGGHVIFVTPKGSPLDVADAIEVAAEEAPRVSVLPTAQALTSPAPTWDSVIDSTALLYQQVIEGSLSTPEDRRVAGMVDLAAQSSALNGGPKWR